MVFPDHIFKAYDIRGLVEGELSVDLAYRIGRAFVIFLRGSNQLRAEHKIIVGRDMRPSSVPFEEAVVRGIVDEGVNVVRVGLVTTPLFNFAVTSSSAHAGGIMITASHNPAAYNGFKLTLANGLPIGRLSGMAELKELVQGPMADPTGVAGTVETSDPLKAYFAKIFSFVNPRGLRPLKVVIDAGNGMAAATFPALVRELPGTYEFLFIEPDGTFPNHEANPLKTETLAALRRRVVETKADFGFALDGDADRIGLVDERGEVVDPSFVAGLIGLEVLRDHPGAKMWYDVRISHAVKEVWEEHGAQTEVCPVGHALVKKLLKEQGGAYAAELSLHQYFHDMNDVESTDLSFLYTLRALTRENRPLSEVVTLFKRYHHSGEVNFEVHAKEAALKRLRERFGAEASATAELDGLSFYFPWGWFNVRSSNTEPLLRLNLETYVADDLESRRAEIIALINSAE